MLNLPGSVYSPDSNSFCETLGHEHIPAVRKVQGETDSFGAEYHHMCQECYDAFNNAPDAVVVDKCEWCKTDNVNVFPQRDIDEGFNGPVYMVCGSCIQKQNKAAQEELDRYEDDVCVDPREEVPDPEDDDYYIGQDDDIGVDNGEEDPNLEENN